MRANLTPHHRAFEHCAACPKLCRDVCPVSEATQREDTTPWAKMNRAQLSELGHAIGSPGEVPTSFACSGCMRCHERCGVGNDVAGALFAMRARSLEQHALPPGAEETLQRFAANQCPFPEDLASAAAVFRPESPVRYSLFPGCSALARRPEVVRDALAVGEKLGAPFGVCRASSKCCGYPLYAAGDRSGFAVHAERFAAALQDYPELVVLDPGCAYTLKVLYPRFGVEVEGRVTTIFEVLESHLEHSPLHPQLPMRAVYHDACHLGRGLGVYEPPRRLLAAAVDEVVEAEENRELAGCTGGGGLMPRVMGAEAKEMARRLGNALRSQGPEGAPGAVPEREAPVIVTACPTSKRMFERAGHPAEDLLSLVRRWLAG